MRAVIYARVSQDRDGKGRSPDEQINALKRVADSEGWEHGPIIRDDGIGASRYSGKARPGYAQLTDTLRADDVLMVWEQSRLSRQVGEIADLLKLCRERGVKLYDGTSVIDPDNPEHEYQTTLSAAASALEAGRTSKRVIRNARARAESGKPHGDLGFGYRRVFDTDGSKRYALDEPQAALIRKAVSDILTAGKSITRIVKEWNNSGVARPTRKNHADEWQHIVVKQTLLRPALAGIRVYRGEPTDTPGDWPAIITHDEHLQLKAILTDPERYVAHGPAPTRLLTGIATCGKVLEGGNVCGRSMRWANQGVTEKLTAPRHPQYRCPLNHVSRRADKVDERTREIMRYLVDKWRARELLATPEPDETVALARIELDRLNTDLLQAAKEEGAGQRTRAEYLAFRDGIMPRIERQKTIIESSAVDPILYALPWDATTTIADADIDQQRAFIRAALRVEILPTGRGARVFDPRSIRYTDISTRGPATVLLLRN
ncbi:recombinase family protein [Rhodococcoides yunnanense]|uniref:recombinase family protein n=1 Tax=Rhodococcoides yunnanense TaxID=278209 RepID=UPI001114B47F|nr:recombinase family protein [Rhodococcus yunnanensis]